LISIFSRCVGVVLGCVLWIDVIKFELIGHAVHTPDDVVKGGLRFPSHLADAQSADVVVAAVRDEDVVEVTQTNWAAVLVHFVLVGLEVVDEL